MSTDLHTLSGAYALNALSPAEAEEFRKHLAGCTACCDEVLELRQVAAEMGAIESSQPPADLKARVLAAAAQTPQRPPRVPSVPSVAAEKARRRWAPRMIAAAAAVILVVAGGVVIGNLSQDEPGSNLATGVSQVFNQDDVRTATVDTTNGGRLVVATSATRGEMAVDTSDLKPLSAAQVYQLWTVANDQSKSQGVLNDLNAGKAMPMPAPGTRVAITIEPAGGSEQPTTDPIITLDPTSV